LAHYVPAAKKPRRLGRGFREDFKVEKEKTVRKRSLAISDFAVQLSKQISHKRLQVVYRIPGQLAPDSSQN
jgi:hypothetical protein